jgi:hypothetical protein
MAAKDPTVSTLGSKIDASAFLNWGQERTEAALALQKDVLAAYDEASRVWLARLQSEVALWSDLATKLGTTRTVPEALEAYTKCVSQRMKMAADDGRLLADEAQQIARKIKKSLGNGGWPIAN